MYPLDKKHKAVRLASRIYATILFPVGKKDWEKARKKTEKVLMNLAETLLEEHHNSPAEVRRRKKEKLKALREHLQKSKKAT